MAKGDIIFIADKETLDQTKIVADEIKQAVSNMHDNIENEVVVNTKKFINELSLQSRIGFGSYMTTLVNLTNAKGVINSAYFMAEGTSDSNVIITIDGVELRFDSRNNSGLIGLVPQGTYNYNKSIVGGYYRSISKYVTYSSFSKINGKFLPTVSPFPELYLINSPVEFNESLKIEAWGKKGKPFNSNISVLYNERG